MNRRAFLASVTGGVLMGASDVRAATRRTADYTCYFQRRAGLLITEGGVLESMWAAEPRPNDPNDCHLFWGSPTGPWPPAHWEEFMLEGDYIVNPGWNSEDGTAYYELRTTKSTIKLSSLGPFDITVPNGPERYALATVLCTEYTIDTQGELWVRGGAKFGTFEHVVTWSPPEPILNPKYWSGPQTVECIKLHERWSDSGGAKSEAITHYALGYGIGWTMIDVGNKITSYMYSGWPY